MGRDSSAARPPRCELSRFAGFTTMSDEARSDISLGSGRVSMRLRGPVVLSALRTLSSSTRTVERIGEALLAIAIEAAHDELLEVLGQLGEQSCEGA